MNGPMSSLWSRNIGWVRPAFAIPVLTIVVLCAIFASAIAPFSPTAINPAAALQSPSWTHIFGTDQFGRDVFSRVVHGSRITLSIAVSSVVIASVIGVPLGITLAYVGGITENIGMRATDVIVSLPETFVAIFVVALLGNSLEIIILTIGFLYLPQFVKVSHNTAKTINANEFVLAAASLGAGPARIIFREILPNMIPIVIVQLSFTLSFAMLLEAGLSFLGLGVPPPAPSWGEMVGTLKGFIGINFVPVLFPASALLLTILAVNVLGDWLQDYLNPEVR